jgi:3-oxoacyl-[acyl-carrier-protein] synthase II
MIQARMRIAGIGLVGGFGCGKQALLDALSQGGRPNGEMLVSLESGSCRLPAYQADVAQVRQWAPKGPLRRMNRFGKMAILAASLALEDAGWQMPLQPAQRHDVALVIASGYGASKSTFDFLDTMIDDGGRCPSPTLFANSVHSSAAAHLSIVLQVGGPCLTVSQFEMSPISALLTARQWLSQGRVEAVLFGAVDEMCPILGYCYDRFFGPPISERIEPFAWERQSAIMGEGAVFMLLTRDKGNTEHYGFIEDLCWAQTHDVCIPNDYALVLGADGHTCCADAYRRVSEHRSTKTAYAPIYGSLPGGQAFEVAIAALAAQAQSGPDRICSVKCNKQESCGVITCRFDV